MPILAMAATGPFANQKWYDEMCILGFFFLAERVSFVVEKREGDP